MKVLFGNFYKFRKTYFYLAYLPNKEVNYA
jgi:hypothetical protein